MRRVLLAATLPLACLTAPAMAQQSLPPVDETETLDEFAETLSDPVRQQEIAGTLSVLTEVLLDLPLAPIIEPFADVVGSATGEPVEPIDPDTTLRQMAPGASDLSGEIQQNVPEAMDRMAAMSGSLAALIPALRDMSERLREALPADTFGDTFER